MNMNRNYDVLRALNCRPIAFYPLYRAVTGSTTAGIVLSQLMYWFSKSDRIYKTDTDIQNETGLSENELRSAKTRIKKLPFIRVTLEGIPAKTFYEILWDEYESSMVKATEQGSWNPRNCDSEIHGTITESTSENETKRKSIGNQAVADMPSPAAIQANQDSLNSMTPPVPATPPGRESTSHNSNAPESYTERLERLWD